MHEVLVNRLEGLSLPRKSVVRLTDRPDMTLDVYRGRKTTIQQQQQPTRNQIQNLLSNLQVMVILLCSPIRSPRKKYIYSIKSLPKTSHRLYLGPVVQRIVSLMSSLGGQLVKCFTTL